MIALKNEYTNPGEQHGKEDRQTEDNWTCM
jgi:hypothetical protein